VSLFASERASAGRRCECILNLSQRIAAAATGASDYLLSATQTPRARAEKKLALCEVRARRRHQRIRHKQNSLSLAVSPTLLLCSVGTADKQLTCYTAWQNACDWMQMRSSTKRFGAGKTRVAIEKRSRQSKGVHLKVLERKIKVFSHVRTCNYLM